MESDTKSPKEWECGSCVYLTIEDQQCLDFGIVEVIPFKAYTRKNIGYLWAIQQGATTIFDTDDDNLPNSKDIAFESPTESVITYRPGNSLKRSVNVYSHFGRPDIWPRGFPLSEIDIRQPTLYLPSYNSLPEPERKLVAPPVLIQQGLADLDPDVDAIFRLTQGQELKKAKFCKKSPAVQLSPGSFCPFNSQNTLFGHDAFWGLLLPITVCDIWRGYWVQRILWDVNGSLSFTKPTVDQIRNAHDYHADYEDELQIYSDTSRLIDFLANWSSRSRKVETRIVDLMKAMAKENFIGAADVDLAKRWVKDLQRVGYVFPKVTSYNHKATQKSLNTCQKSPQHLVDSYRLSHEALKQCKSDTDPAMAKIQVTESKDPSTVFKDILLVVNFNWPLYNAIEPFLSIYKPYFPNIVMYGGDVPDHLLGIVKSVDNDRGNTGYRSLVMAMEEYPNYSGYLYTNDDTVLNVFQLAEFDQDKVWKHVPILSEDLRDRSKPPPFPWHHWGKPGTTNMWNDPTSLTEVQKQRIANFTKIQGPADIKSYCDAVYVPARISLELKDVLTRFLKYDVFLELGVGLALVAVEPTQDWVDWTETYLWYDGSRKKWRNFLKPGVGMVHPVKLLQDKRARDDILNWIQTVEIIY
ncbi:hypothetical protein BGZ51_005257 [Haplosporangium sp. Z 767]|nr:hypothetical protein BGZ50_007618 [Haplosporangium sp. Z 11]KAF9181687.1 hypothetical protein BGZ51_005257 [Haplosporangium sp. Z 767]